MRLNPLKVSLLAAALVCSASAFSTQNSPEKSDSDSRESDADAFRPAPVTKASGLMMLDYQTIKINGYQSIDLMGFHFLNKFNDWLYVGVGGHAPLAKGEYGGFMAFDATIHAERKLFGNLSASIGESFGGGGGGKSIQQSRVISGSGGFSKTYIGLGYHFPDWSVGVNYSKIRFTNSVINGSQFGLFIQVPFSYSIAPYEDSGQRLAADQKSSAGATPDDATDDVVIVGLDNIFQINPRGSYKGQINLVDAQYNHFLTANRYIFFEGSVGYRGLPIYNQALGGVGYRYPYSSRLGLNVQLGVGSGGYAPEKFDTGSGLLVYPKLSAEYLLSRQIGLSLSGGYLYAPRGSAKNLTAGVSLTYHLAPPGGYASSGAASNDLTFSGHRLHLFQQTEFKVKINDRVQNTLKLVSMQIDNIISDHVYIPIQGSVAYNSFLGYPGYGELLAGIGLQNKYLRGDSLQAFAQLLLGTNVHGAIVKPAVGLNYGLSDRLAIYGQVGGTWSLEKLGLYPDRYSFKSAFFGVGFSYRFSLPHR